MNNIDDQHFLKLRERMVETQLVARGIVDEEVLKAMRNVPRHCFVPKEHQQHAYEDRPVSIGSGQTISQPYMVALMTQCLRLKPQDRILEIGTGSGYQTAVLSRLVKEVHTVERIESLAAKAKENLDDLGLHNIKFYVGDGSVDFINDVEDFDGLLLTAAVPNCPAHLCRYLKEGGRMVAPVGTRQEQTLIVYMRQKGELVAEKICQCVFVPLIGKRAWSN